MNHADRRSQRERMLAGEPYLASDPELQEEHLHAAVLCERFNRASPGERVKRQRILRQLLGSVGEGVEIRPPFHCDYGHQIRIGARTFANLNLVALDVAQGLGDSSLSSRLGCAECASVERGLFLIVRRSWLREIDEHRRHEEERERGG